MWVIFFYQRFICFHQGTYDTRGVKGNYRHQNNSNSNEYDDRMVKGKTGKYMTSCGYNLLCKVQNDIKRILHEGTFPSSFFEPLCWQAREVMKKDHDRFRIVGFGLSSVE